MRNSIDIQHSIQQCKQMGAPDKVSWDKMGNSNRIPVLGARNILWFPRCELIDKHKNGGAKVSIVVQEPVQVEKQVACIRAVVLYIDTLFQELPHCRKGRFFLNQFQQAVEANRCAPNAESLGPRDDCFSYQRRGLCKQGRNGLFQGRRVE